MSELRTTERAPIEIEVDLESEHNFYSGLTCNIGEGGIFVTTHVPPKLGEFLSLQLRLPGERHAFHVRGVVRWLRELRVESADVSPGFGMQWTEISDEALQVIRNFVDRRDTIFYEAA